MQSFPGNSFHYRKRRAAALPESGTSRVCPDPHPSRLGYDPPASASLPRRSPDYRLASFPARKRFCRLRKCFFMIFFSRPFYFSFAHSVVELPQLCAIPAEPLGRSGSRSCLNSLRILGRQVSRNFSRSIECKLPPIPVRVSRIFFNFNRTAGSRTVIQKQAAHNISSHLREKFASIVALTKNVIMEIHPTYPGTKFQKNISPVSACSFRAKNRTRLNFR